MRARHKSSTIARRIGFVVAVVLFAIVRYSWLRVVRWKKQEHARAQVLTDTLETLGATFIKFGQILSTRPDLLSPVYIRELERLQDSVPADDFVQVEKVLSEAWNEQQRQQIARIEKTPIASASIAQVHEAWLLNGKRLAIKVQRLYARRTIELDILLLQTFARALEVFSAFRLLAVREAVQVFARAMEEQLDFRIEASNNERFCENFKDSSSIFFPSVLPELSSERVLVMEFVEGVRVTSADFDSGARRRLAEHGFDAILQMVFADGFVHADLHPGNILVTADERMCFLDLGLVADIPTELRAPWIETFVAVSARDAKRAAALFYTFSPSVDDCVSFEAFEADVEKHFRSFHGKPLHELETSQVVGGMMNVLRKHRVTVDPTFTVVNLAMIVADGLGKQLDPTLDLARAAMPHLARAMVRAPASIPPRRSVPSPSGPDTVAHV